MVAAVLAVPVPLAPGLVEERHYARVGRLDRVAQDHGLRDDVVVDVAGAEAASLTLTLQHHHVPVSTVRDRLHGVTGGVARKCCATWIVTLIVVVTVIVIAFVFVFAIVIVIMIGHLECVCSRQQRSRPPARGSSPWPATLPALPCS